MLFLTARSNKIEDCMEVLKDKCSEQNDVIHELKRELLETRNIIKYSPSRLDSKHDGDKHQMDEYAYQNEI